MPGDVARMRLAGEDELNRYLGVVDERDEAFQIAQHEVGALVGGEAAREADRERVEAQRVAHLIDELERLAALARRTGRREAARLR